MLPRTAAVSVPDPVAGHCRLTPLPEAPGHSQEVWLRLLWGHCSFLLGPGVHRFCCACQESVSPVLWKFCNQIPLDFKVKFLGSSQSLCWIPRLGNLLLGLELSQQCENFFYCQYNCSPVCGSSAQLLYSGANGDLLQEDFCHMLCLPGLLQPKPLSP